MTNNELNLGKIITWCQNWLITTNRATNAKDYEILGRAIVGCFQIKINEIGGIYITYGLGKDKLTKADKQASELVAKAVTEYLLKQKKEN